MAEHKLTFTFKKETSGTRVYEEQPPKGQPPVVGSLYIKKWAAGSADMVTLTLNIPD